MKHKSRGDVDRRQAKHVKQHELNTAARLAKAGFDVVFRQPKQGPNFVVDVGESPLPLDRVVVGMQALCGAYPDTEIASIMAVDVRSDGSAAVQTVGKEVPGWRR